MILDSSALIAVALREPGYEVLEQALVSNTACKISAPTFLEVSIILLSRTGADGVLLWESLVRKLDIAIEPFTEDHALTARQAFSDFGKGRHPAGLNFGDCFSYALSKVTDEPLLFKGDDFRKTDVLPAIP